MKPKILLICITIMISSICSAQSYLQYFDGADTTEWGSLFMEIDSNTTNIWQIAMPSKTIFDSSATYPNAIITDSINYYPANNSSSFTMDIPLEDFGWGILALQWSQKLDMDSGFDGGLIEFSTDEGLSWESVFNNEYVYNFYGYEEENFDTLTTGDFAFSGTDSTWKNIWLCFETSWLDWEESLSFRFTLKTDSVEGNKEGWVMDNFSAYITVIHTVNEETQEEYMLVGPNPSNGRIEINTKKNNEYHIIERIEVLNSNGAIVKEYGVSPVKFAIDISDQPDGIYFIKIKTNIKEEVFKIVKQH